MHFFLNVCCLIELYLGLYVNFGIRKYSCVQEIGKSLDIIARISMKCLYSRVFSCDFALRIYKPRLATCMSTLRASAGSVSSLTVLDKENITHTIIDPGWNFETLAHSKESTLHMSVAVDHGSRFVLRRSCSFQIEANVCGWLTLVLPRVGPRVEFGPQFASRLWCQDPMARCEGWHEVSQAFRGAKQLRGGKQLSPAYVTPTDSPTVFVVHLHHEYCFFNHDVVRTLHPASIPQFTFTMMRWHCVWSPLEEPSWDVCVLVCERSALKQFWTLHMTHQLWYEFSSIGTKVGVHGSLCIICLHHTVRPKQCVCLKQCLSQLQATAQVISFWVCVNWEWIRMHKSCKQEMRSHVMMELDGIGQIAHVEWHWFGVPLLNWKAVKLARRINGIFSYIVTPFILPV